MKNFVESINDVLDWLSILSTKVGIYNAAGLYDINSLAEDILIPVLKKVFDCPNLASTNTKKRNYPAIDLYDEEAKLAFQITSDPSGDKIKNTLEEFIQNKFYEKYDRLIVLILTTKQQSYKFTNPANYTNEINFEFDRNQDILDLGELGNLIRNLGSENLAKIQEIDQILEHTLTKKLKADQPLVKFYIPVQRDVLFLPRPNELEALENRLFIADNPTATQSISNSIKLGLIGLGGIGKTQLAVQLAYRCLDKFPAGVFWMPASGTSSDWVRELANLALNTNILPNDDNPIHQENELRRAQHFCRYVAGNNKVLLLLDNVDDISSTLSKLTSLAGKELRCSIIYTSRFTDAPPGVAIYNVEKLPLDVALRVMLTDVRPTVLQEIQEKIHNADTEAAKSICEMVDSLPLALVHLRALLKTSPALTLSKLHQVLIERNRLQIIDKKDRFSTSLQTTFQLSWERITDSNAQKLFILACYFPEALPIQLWLLGIITGLGQEAEPFDPLGEAKNKLIENSLIENFGIAQIRLHPLVMDFGRQLITTNPEIFHQWVADSGRNLVDAFENIEFLAELCRKQGYWDTFSTIRTSIRFVKELKIEESKERLTLIEKRLDKESYFLANSKLSSALPQLFSQQLYNRLVEEGIQPPEPSIPNGSFWFRKLHKVGNEDPALLRILFEHDSDLWSATLTPDNSKIMTHSRDKTVALWEADSGKLLTRIGAEIAIFFPDGSKVLIADGNNVLLVDTATSEVSTVITDSSPVKLLALASQKSKLITISEENIIKIWHIENYKQLASVVVLGEQTSALEVSKSELEFATGSNDGTLTVWNLETLESIYNKVISQERLTKISFSSDGRIIATAVLINKQPFIKAYNLADQQEALSLEGHEGVITAVKFSPDGRFLASSSGDRTVRLWDINTGTEIHQFSHRNWINNFAFSHDGSKLAVADSDSKIYLWEVQTENLLALFSGHTGQIRNVTFSADDSKLVSASEDKTVRIWELANSVKPFISSPATVDAIRVFNFFSDKSHFISGSSSGHIILWESSSGTVKKVLKKFDISVSAIAISLDGSKIAVGFDNHPIEIWDINLENCLYVLDTLGQECISIQFTRDDSTLAAIYRNNIVCLWNNLFEKILEIPLPGSTLQTLSTSPTGNLLGITNTRGGVFLLKLEPGEQPILFSTIQYQAFIGNVAFSLDETRIAIGLHTKIVYITEIEPFNERHKEVGLLYGGHTDRIYTVKYSPDGKFIVTSSGNGEIRLWIAKGKNQGAILGAYNCGHHISAFYWQNPELLIILGYSYDKPKFYVHTLKIEGSLQDNISYPYLNL